MNIRSTIARLWGSPQPDDGTRRTDSFDLDTAAKAIRWGVSEMDLLLTIDGKDCPGCDVPGHLCHGAKTGIFVPDGINVDDLVREIERIVGPSNAFGRVNHAAFYLDPAQITEFSAAAVMQLLTAVGNALTGLGHRVDLNAGLSAANQILGY